MSVVTRKSTAIGNRDSVPVVASMAAYAGGRVNEAEGYVQAVNGDSAGSVYPMCSVPSNSRVSQVLLQCAALGAGSEVNCGVYAPTAGNPALSALGYGPGAAINASFFASAQATSSALAMTDITNQSGSNTIADQELELWDALGLASDPGCDLDIGLAVAVAIAATGDIGLKVKYVF